MYGAIWMSASWLFLLRHYYNDITSHYLLILKNAHSTILLFMGIAKCLPRASSFKSHAYWSLSNKFNSVPMSLNEIYA